MYICIELVKLEPRATSEKRLSEFDRFAEFQRWKTPLGVETEREREREKEKEKRKGTDNPLDVIFSKVRHNEYRRLTQPRAHTVERERERERIHRPLCPL